MRISSFSIALLFLAGFTLFPHAQGDAKSTAAPAVELVCELTDGSRVIGTSSIGRLKITARYARLEFQLSQSRMIEFSGPNHIARVNLQNGDLLNGKLNATEITVKTNSGQVVVPLAKVGNIRICAGSIGGDYVNSLGMELVAVPGTNVLFSIWDTRVQDYRAYAEANPGVDANWKNHAFKQGDDHPVVNVSWNDAEAFCAWLTQKERKEAKIRQDQEYRLPTDKEWSAAVGAGKYPWGNEWPPPKGAGNYNPGFEVDDYEYTSPVGSFRANQYGLYDMGGNVLQWCEDWYRTDMNEFAVLDKNLGWDDGGGLQYRVCRGSSFHTKAPGLLLSSVRCHWSPDGSTVAGGFRCVLVAEPSQ